MLNCPAFSVNGAGSDAPAPRQREIPTPPSPGESAVREFRRAERQTRSRGLPAPPESEQSETRGSSFHSRLHSEPPSRLRPVGGRSCVGLPDGDALDAGARRAAVHSLRGFVEKILCDVLRRWIECVKRRLVVQKLVVHSEDDFLQDLFHVSKVVQQPDRIQGCPFQQDLHFVIVAVRVLALPLIAAQSVARRKSFLNADLEHVRPFGLSSSGASGRLPHEPFYFRDVPGGGVLRQ